MKNQVICVGELLIDFICTDVNVSLANGNIFHKKAGGAPANVAVSVSRLGGNVAYAGCVGKDAFGDFLEGVLSAEGIDTQHLARSDKNTTLAFVSLQEDGERDFEFFRGADADLQLSAALVEEMEQSKIAHFGSATAFLEGSLNKAYKTLMSIAGASDTLFSLDPNYRDGLFAEKKTVFKACIFEALPLADIIKVSEEELAFLTDTQNMSEGIDRLSKMGARRVLVTRGRKGAYYWTQSYDLQTPACRIEAVDTTGAGDAFIGAVLSQLLLESSPATCLDMPEKMREILKNASIVGACTCERIGAIESMPTLSEFASRKKSIG